MTTFLRAHKEVAKIREWTVTRKPINLALVVALDRDLDQCGYNKTYRIVFHTTSGFIIWWQYDTEAERDAEYENILKTHGYQLDAPQG